MSGTVPQRNALQSLLDWGGRGSLCSPIDCSGWRSVVSLGGGDMRIDIDGGAVCSCRGRPWLVSLWINPLSKLHTYKTFHSLISLQCAQHLAVVVVPSGFGYHHTSNGLPKGANGSSHWQKGGLNWLLFACLEHFRSGAPG